MKQKKIKEKEILPTYEKTKFTQDYLTSSIVCYVCGTRCSAKSREHELFCLECWYKDHKKDAFYAPTKPDPFPDPFNSTRKQIAMYNEDADNSANKWRIFVDPVTYMPDNVMIKALGEVTEQSYHRFFRPKKKISTVDDNQETEKKKSVLDKHVLPRKKLEKTPNIILHSEIQKKMNRFAPLLPELPDPGRIPRGHLYGYMVDQQRSTSKLCLKPYFVAPEAHVKAGLPDHSGLASRRAVNITPRITTV
ncbi:hypothetical protein Ahia01_000643500 [Argonauta hians]